MGTPERLLTHLSVYLLPDGSTRVMAIWNEQEAMQAVEVPPGAYHQLHRVLHSAHDALEVAESVVREWSPF
jgi:hypothetical protein